MTQQQLNFNDAPGITLSDMTEQYMILSFNDKKTYFLNYLFHAQQVFKALFRNTIYSVVQVSVPLEYSTKEGYFIRKPKGLSRLLSISVVEDGQYYPLIISEKVATEIIEQAIPKKCKCVNKANFNSVLDTRIEVSTEVFHNNSIKLKKYFQHNGDGTILEVQEFPVYNQSTGLVTIEKKTKVAASVSVDTCGCIKDTPENKTMLFDKCGLNDYYYNEDFSFNTYGYYNWTVDGQKIFIYPSSDIYANAKKLPKTVVVSFQTNGVNASGDFIVPEDAAMALWAGMTYYASLHSQTDNRLRIRELKRYWENEKENLMYSRNPIHLETLKSIEGRIHKWG